MFFQAVETLKGFEKKDSKMQSTAATNLSFMYFLVSRRTSLYLLCHVSSLKVDLFIMVAIGKKKEGKNLKARLVRPHIRKDKQKPIRIHAPNVLPWCPPPPLAVIMNEVYTFYQFLFSIFFLKYLTARRTISG